MPQASTGLSISPANCNDDPGQEHFDQTLLACGNAVTSLINSAPRTPTAEQIRDLIRDTMRQGFESSAAAEIYKDDEDERTLGRSQDPNDPLAFEGVAGADFPITNHEFGMDYLPWVRLAYRFLRHDRAQAVADVRKMMDDGNEELIDVTLEHWEVTEAKFKLLVEALQAAQARLEIAYRHVAKEGRP